MKLALLISVALSGLSLAAPTENDVARDVSKRGWLLKTPTVRSVLAAKRAHVGQLISGDLYKRVEEALSALCPPGRTGRCDDNVEYRIPGIWYDGGNGFVRDDGYLFVKVLNTNIPAGEDGIRETLIATLADIVKTQVQDEKNCFTVDSTNKGKVYMCNIGEWLNVYEGITEGQDKSHPYVEAHFKFSTPYLAGKFDCVAIREASLRALQAHLSDFARAFKVNEVTAINGCSSEEVDG